MMEKSIGLIVARAGSKGVKNKNIRLVCGKPLIAYTFEAALESKKLDQIIVSTDSEEVVRIANYYGISVPKLRPAEFSQDTSTDYDVVAHALNNFIETNDAEHGSIVYLRPTTPFKTGKLIDECIEKFSIDFDSSALRTVTRVKGSENPAWQYIKKNGIMESVKLEGLTNRPARRQDLPEIYKVNGLVDIVRYQKKQLPKDLFWSAKSFYITDDDVSLDIDDEKDLAYCEYIMKSL